MRAAKDREEWCLMVEDIWYVTLPGIGITIKKKKKKIVNENQAMTVYWPAANDGGGGGDIDKIRFAVLEDH